MPTPHISANDGDFAKTVIMPGDPKRSEYIVEKFLTDAKLVNDVRGVQGYTGLYKGKKVSVMAHGMGMPSMAIYAHELYNFYGVENIIRIGSCGAINENIKIKDVVLANPVVTESNIGRAFKERDEFAYPTEILINKVLKTAEKLKISVKQGLVLCSDLFYKEEEESIKWKDKGALAVEMESYVLYKIAKEYNKNAVCLLTVADMLYDRTFELSAEERQKSFDEMITLALESAVE